MYIFNKEKKTRGYLALIGGAEDRKGDKIVLKSIIAVNNAKTVVVIPSATSYPVESGKDYEDAFKSIGVETVHVFDIRDKKEADEPRYHELLDNADMIFFTGGDQVRLVKALKDTALLDKIRKLYINKGVTIAGTSAGAAAASDPMTFDGDNMGLIKGAVEFSRGFGFIENVTIDTHFVVRGRIGRMTQFLCSKMSDRGIGLGENTAILINPDNIFEVVGEGIVTMVDNSEITYSNIDKIIQGEKISIDGIRVGFLQHGTIFDINKWAVIGQKGESIKSSNDILNLRN